MNFYKRHIGDYIKDAGHLKLLEHGVYARLMDVYYTREAGIPQDKAARLIGASTRPEMEALKFVLSEFFTLVDGAWIQKRCEEEIAVASAKAEKNRQNGKAGGRPKKQEPEQNPDGSDIGNHVGSKNNLSQTPDSRLQTPDKNLEASSQASTGVGRDDSPPAERENPNELPQMARNVAISLLLRGQKVQATSQNPIVAVTWAQNPKVTDEVLNVAITKAKAAKPGEQIPVKYLARIVETLLAEQDAPPPEQKAQPQREDWAWKRSNAGIDKKGRELGLFARGGESYPDFAARIQAAIDQRKGAKP